MSEYGSTSCGRTSDIKFQGLSRDYKARLWAVIALNASMFAVEMGGGVMAGSQALQADALDFLGDTLTYGMSLAVIGLSLRVRATAALINAATLALMGLWVFGAMIWHAFVLGTPRAELMGLIGFLALAVNMASVLILLKYKDGDANVRSVWLCSRNDAIGNVAVMLAALGVWSTATVGRMSLWRRSSPRCFSIRPARFCARRLMSGERRGAYLWRRRRNDPTTVGECDEDAP